jgi:hypothetical protein
MNKFACILVVATSFWTAMALAQERHGTAEQRAACAPDAFRLCASYIPESRSGNFLSQMNRM